MTVSFCFPSKTKDTIRISLLNILMQALVLLFLCYYILIQVNLSKLILITVYTQEMLLPDIY